MLYGVSLNISFDGVQSLTPSLFKKIYILIADVYYVVMHGQGAEQRLREAEEKLEEALEAVLDAEMDDLHDCEEGEVEEEDQDNFREEEEEEGMAFMCYMYVCVFMHTFCFRGVEWVGSHLLSSIFMRVAW